MLFCSWNYLVFFAGVAAVYWAIPHQRFRVCLLLAASCFFYASWSFWLTLVVVGSATLDFFLALGIGATANPTLRKTLLATSVIANLALLCGFKYVNFFLDTLRTTLEACGSAAAVPVLEIILPIGISFYTFEAISYVADVY